MSYTFCPQCAKPLLPRIDEGLERHACPDDACGFVHWDNPVQVATGLALRDWLVSQGHSPAAIDSPKL